MLSPLKGSVRENAAGLFVWIGNGMLLVFGAEKSWCWYCTFIFPNIQSWTCLLQHCIHHLKEHNDLKKLPVKKTDLILHNLSLFLFVFHSSLGKSELVLDAACKNMHVWGRHETNERYLHSCPQALLMNTVLSHPHILALLTQLSRSDNTWSADKLR